MPKTSPSTKTAYIPKQRRFKTSAVKGRARILFLVLSCCWQVLRRTGPFPRRRKYRNLDAKKTVLRGVKAAFKMLSVRETFERVTVPAGEDATWEEPRAPSALQVLHRPRQRTVISGTIYLLQHAFVASLFTPASGKDASATSVCVSLLAGAHGNTGSNW